MLLANWNQFSVHRKVIELVVNAQGKTLTGASMCSVKIMTAEPVSTAQLATGHTCSLRMSLSSAQCCSDSKPGKPFPHQW